MSFRPASHSLHAKLTKEVRQAEGIYFTPAAMRTRLLDLVAAAGVTTPTTVLEPSFGSGEFVFDLLERFPAAKIHGVELNRTAFLETAGVVSGLSSEDKARIVLTNTDFLKYSGCAGSSRADLIVGNPPYFVTKQKDPRCMTGRGNVFVQFIYKCLTEHLREGGVLAFVLPTSFYNCCYYDPCRRYIAANTTILAVEEVATSEFYETAQETMLFVVRKALPSTAGAHPYVLTAAGSTYINPHAAELAVARAEAGSTIASLGCAVKTGEVVWNQHKEKLTADPSGANTVLVLYSNNIKGGVLQVGDPGKGKQQYIRNFESASGPTTGPAILVSRGYGNTTYSLNFVVVPEGMRFYGENHVNVITGPAEGIARIASSLADARTGEFIQRFVGNGALSKTELESVLPIW